MKKGEFGFLLIGAGRGGTSLMAGLLDQHSSLEVKFEGISQDYLMARRMLFEGKHNLIHNRVEKFRKGCERQAKRYPNRYWGIKITSEHVLELKTHNKKNPLNPVEEIEYFFEKGLQNVKVIFILRDGRTCVRSKVARKGLSVEEACERWKYSTKIFDYLADRPETLRIRFEDVIMNPAKNLKLVTDFLGIEYEEEMLKGTQSTKMKSDYRNLHFDKSKLDLTNIPDGCVQQISDELSRLNYISLPDTL